MVIYIVIYFLETSLFLSNICKGFFLCLNHLKILSLLLARFCIVNAIRDAMILRNNLVEREVNLEV